MVQKYEAGKEFPELLIGNYDLYERERRETASDDAVFRSQFRLRKNLKGVYYIMQEKIVKGFIFMPVPADLFMASGIEPLSLLRYSASEGRIVIEVMDGMEDGIACDGDCENCPHADTCEESEVF